MYGHGLKMDVKAVLFLGKAARNITIVTKGTKKPGGPLVIVARPIATNDKI